MTVDNLENRIAMLSEANARLKQNEAYFATARRQAAEERATTREKTIEKWASSDRVFLAEIAARLNELKQSPFSGFKYQIEGPIDAEGVAAGSLSIEFNEHSEARVHFDVRPTGNCVVRYSEIHGAQIVSQTELDVLSATRDDYIAIVMDYIDALQALLLMARA